VRKREEEYTVFPSMSADAVFKMNC
jgi:hypothetical protein